MSLWNYVSTTPTTDSSVPAMCGLASTETLSLLPRSVPLSGRFRVGGSVGDEAGARFDPSTGATAPLSSAFDTAAHRFTVLIPQPLDGEQESVVRHVLDTERPAHTTYELCSVEAGMRAGRGTQVGISSIVGPTGSFSPAITDRSLLGSGTILGGGSTGIAVEAGRIDTTARVG